ncbi:unnamed protein product, partial [marine sediment metagenome]
MATIGAAAIARALGFSANRTIIEKSNPAAGAFTILKVMIYADQAMQNVEVATFQNIGGNTFTTRNTAFLGDVPAGYSEHGVSIGAEAGDYIGCHYSAGKVSLDTVGGVGTWYLEGDYIPCSGQVFSYVADYKISLSGDDVAPVSVAIAD